MGWTSPLGHFLGLGRTSKFRVKKHPAFFSPAQFKKGSGWQFKLRADPFKINKKTNFNYKKNMA